MKREQVLQILRAHRAEIQNLGVKSLALFGSVARDEATPDSDIDLLVEFNRPTGLFGMIELERYLSDLLNCSVDLGTTRSLKPSLSEGILKEAILVT